MSKFWIFDFDGTLVDSESAIRKCYMSITSEIAPSRINTAQTILIGPTLDESSREILGQELLHLLPDFKQAFQYEYDSHTVFETLTYPAADNVLRTLRSRGDRIGLATNKRLEPTSALIKYYKWNDYFEFIACLDQFAYAKNKAEMLSTMLKKHDNFTNASMVGDTLPDGIAAKGNHLRFIKANYGYGKDLDWRGIPVYKTINQISEILTIADET